MPGVCSRYLRRRRFPPPVLTDPLAAAPSSSSLCRWSAQAAPEADVGWRRVKPHTQCIGVCCRGQACGVVCIALVFSLLLHACQYRDESEHNHGSSVTTSASRAHARLPVCDRNGGTFHRFAVVPRRRVEDGGLADGVPFPWRRVNVRGGLVGGTVPSCSRACSARTPTL
jgi:hypothetical protein